MAGTVLKAYYENENHYGVIDRLEIYGDGTVGALELTGRAPIAFDFEHREITGQQQEHLSIHENPVIMGVLDFYARIDTPEKEALVKEIADSPSGSFQLVWKRNGEEVWYGYPYGRVIEYPEQKKYNVKIQFRDFEFLKGKDYPLEDKRQKVINTFQSLLSGITLLRASFPLRTMTSWQVQGTTTSDDFLNQIYHDTFALRDYADDGYSEDQQISYFEALQRACEPMLIMYQWKGFNLVQISALNNPESVQVANYGIIGQLSKSTVDLSQTIHTKDGLPIAKRTGNNTSYPALKRAKYEFKHRSGSSEFEFPIDPEFSYADFVDFGDHPLYSSALEFAGNGDEKIQFHGVYEEPLSGGRARFAIRAGNYALDSDLTWKRPADHSWIGATVSGINTTNGRISVTADIFQVGGPVMLQSVGGSLPANIAEDKIYYIVDKDDGTDWIQISETQDGTAIIPEGAGSGTIWVRDIRIQEETVMMGEWSSPRAIVSFETPDIPAMNGSIEVLLQNQGFGGIWEKGLGRWSTVKVFIENPTQAGESVEYRLSQEDDYPDTLEMRDCYYGDGPFAFSKSSYRRSTDLDSITGAAHLVSGGSWRRRGQTTYVPYSRLRLNEVLDYQRSRQLKKNFDLYGEFDPTKVMVYEEENYMYVGGKYSGHWVPIGVQIQEESDG